MCVSTSARHDALDESDGCVAQRPAIIGARARRSQRARVRDRALRCATRAHACRYFHAHISIASHSRARAHANADACRRRATDPDPIPAISHRIASHRIASRVRTANALNASRRDDASALATTVAWRAVRVACARRGLSAAARAVKEDKVTDDDIFGRVREYGAIARSIVHSRGDDFEGGRGPGRDRSMEAFGHPARVCVARITVVRAVYGGMGVRCMCRGCENLYRMRVRAHGDGVGWSMGRVWGGRGCVRPTDRSTDRGLATPPHLSLIDHSLNRSIDHSIDRSLNRSIESRSIDQ